MCVTVVTRTTRSRNVVLMDWFAVPMVPTSSIVARWAWARPAKWHPIVPVISTTVPWSAVSLSTRPGCSNAVSRECTCRQGSSKIGLTKIEISSNNSCLMGFSASSDWCFTHFETHQTTWIFFFRCFQRRRSWRNTCLWVRLRNIVAAGPWMMLLERIALKKKMLQSCVPKGWPSAPSRAKRCLSEKGELGGFGATQAFWVSSFKRK